MGAPDMRAAPQQAGGPNESVGRRLTSEATPTAVNIQAAQWAVDLAKLDDKGRQYMTAGVLATLFYLCIVADLVTFSIDRSIGGAIAPQLGADRTTIRNRIAILEGLGLIRVYRPGSPRRNIIFLPVPGSNPWHFWELATKGSQP